MCKLHKQTLKAAAEFGKPFDTRLQLLLKWDEAQKAHFRAQIEGNADEAYALSWAATEAQAQVDEHAEHLANLLILMIRLAGVHLTSGLTAALLSLPFFQNLLDGHDDLQARVADLETVVGGTR